MLTSSNKQKTLLLSDYPNLKPAALCGNLHTNTKPVPADPEPYQNEEGRRRGRPLQNEDLDLDRVGHNTPCTPAKIGSYE